MRETISRKYLHYITLHYKYLHCKGSNVKNDLKVKQLAKQPSTLKTLMQKILVGL